jgi:hypothetical protein
MQFANMDLIWESSSACVKLSECVGKVGAMCDDVCITHRRTGVISLGTVRWNACFHLCKFKLK